MNILIFGSGSRVSPYLSNILKEKGYNSIWISSKEKPDWYNGESWVQSSYNSEEIIKELIEKYTPSHILNLSAFTDVDACEDNKMDALFVNYEIPKILSELSSTYSYNIFHISTDYVFSGQKGLYESSDATSNNGIGWYGLTKKDAEEVIIKSGGTIIRTNVLYGDIKDDKTFLSWVRNELLKEKSEEIKIVIDQFNNPTYLNDLANVIVLAIEIGYKGILHTGGKDWMSRWELAQVIALSLNKNPKDILTPISTEELKQKAIRPKFGGLDIKETEIILNFNFTGIYDYLIDNSMFKEYGDFENNPHYLIFKRMIFILKLIDNNIRKKSIINLTKNPHGTISISINSKDYLVEIEIGKSTYSGLLYDISNRNSLELIIGDVYKDENISEFLDSLKVNFSSK